MRVEAEFLTSAADKLAENLDRIDTCLTELPSHALWARDSENENAVGNLFSARTGADASKLVARLHGTVAEAVSLIRSLPHPGRAGVAAWLGVSEPGGS